MKQLYLLSAVVLGLIVLLYIFARLPGWMDQGPDSLPPEPDMAELEAQLQDIQPDGETTSMKTINDFSPETQDLVRNNQTLTATMQTNKGTVVLVLESGRMPTTVGNFVELARSGFYDGVKFHRVMDNFMIQAGDPQSKEDALQSVWGTGGPGYTIADEHVKGEGLSNTRGTISMANAGPQSGGSQFFINLVDNLGLDFDNNLQPNSKHPVFGHVTSGMEVVDAIGSVSVNGTLPVEPVVIESITISS